MSDDEAPQTTSALTRDDAWDVAYVYEILDPHDGDRPIYVGQTVDAHRRWREHLHNADAVDAATAKNGCLKRFFDRVGDDFVAARHLRLVPEVETGVPRCRVDEVEAYFISKRGTVWDLKNPNGCNSSAGTRVYAVDPETLPREIAANDWWPATVDRPDASAPAAVRRARARVDVLRAVETAAEQPAVIVTALIRAEEDRRLAEQEVDTDTDEVLFPRHTPCLRAQHQIRELEALAGHEVLDRAEFARDLNAADLPALCGDDVAYRTALEAMLRSLQLCFSSERTIHRNAAMTISEAIAVWTLVMEFCGRHEEARYAEEFESVVTKTGTGNGINFYEQAVAWRDFARAHDGRMPSSRAIDSSDKILASQQNNWLSNYHGARRRRLDVFLVVLRGIHSFYHKARGRRNNSLSTARMLNDELRSGVSIPCVDPSRDPIPLMCKVCGLANSTRSQAGRWLLGFLRNSSEVIFAGVPLEHKKQWYAARRARQTNKGWNGGPLTADDDPWLLEGTETVPRLGAGSVATKVARLKRTRDEA